MKPNAPNADRKERKNLGEKLFLSQGCKGKSGPHLYRLDTRKKCGKGSGSGTGTFRSGYSVWKCFGCEHYTFDITGKKAICWECGEEFIVGKARRGGRERKVRCGECGGSGVRIGAAAEDAAAPLSPLAEAILDGIID